MIVVNTDKGNTHIEIAGCLSELEADLVMACKGIIKAIEEKDEDIAKEFKKFIKEDLSEEIDYDFAASIAKKLKGKSIDDLLGMLAEWLIEDEDDEN